MRGPSSNRSQKREYRGIYKPERVWKAVSDNISSSVTRPGVKYEVATKGKEVETKQDHHVTSGAHGSFTCAARGGGILAFHSLSFIPGSY